VPRPLDLVLVHMGDRQADDRFIFVNDMHRASVSELGHRDLGQVSERLLVVERG
jgi:hypothetical protein